MYGYWDYSASSLPTARQATPSIHEMAATARASGCFLLNYWFSAHLLLKDVQTNVSHTTRQDGWCRCVCVLLSKVIPTLNLRFQSEFAVRGAGQQAGFSLQVSTSANTKFRFQENMGESIVYSLSTLRCLCLALISLEFWIVDTSVLEKKSQAASDSPTGTSDMFMVRKTCFLVEKMSKIIPSHPFTSLEMRSLNPIQTEVPNSLSTVAQ